MIFKWLNKTEQNRELIVFFNGWGFDADAVSHLNCENFDVLVISDYRNLNIICHPELVSGSQDFEMLKQVQHDRYEKKYLICWSMGVMVSNFFGSYFDNFDRKIAINGTPQMIDDKFGIPKRIFNITLKLFNENSGEKFARNMLDNNKEIHPKRPWQELKQELESLNLIETEQTMCFDKAYISTDDKIVPPQNQLNYWLNKTSTELLNAPHYPFTLFKSWKEIL